jgi:hypothetical protein
VCTSIKAVNEVKLILIQESACAYFAIICQHGKEERCMQGFGTEILRKKN